MSDKRSEFVMSPNGKVVSCHDWAPKSKQAPHDQSRAVCLAEAKEACPSCPNSRFVLKVQANIGQQEVACPRWESEAERLKRKAPTGYVTVRRELCLRIRPFAFCSMCRNGNPANPPESVDGWVERFKRGGD